MHFHHNNWNEKEKKMADIISWFLWRFLVVSMFYCNTEIKKKKVNLHFLWTADTTMVYHSTFDATDQRTVIMNMKNKLAHKTLFVDWKLLPASFLNYFLVTEKISNSTCTISFHKEHQMCPFTVLCHRFLLCHGANMWDLCSHLSGIWHCERKEKCLKPLITLVTHKLMRGYIKLATCLHNITIRKDWCWNWEQVQ